MEDFHPYLTPIYFEMIDINHIIIIGGMRTFNRRIEVGFMEKSAKLTNIGGVMNNHILTKIMLTCACMMTFMVASGAKSESVEQASKKEGIDVKPVLVDKAQEAKDAEYRKAKKEAVNALDRAQSHNTKAWILDQSF